MGHQVALLPLMALIQWIGGDYTVYDPAPRENVTVRTRPL